MAYINYLCILTDCTFLNDSCKNVIYTVHGNDSMSAGLGTMEREEILTCVNNEWKKIYSSTTDYNGMV